MSEFPNCEIKLCDLEVSRVIQDHEQIREIIGTPDYVGTDDIEKYHTIENIQISKKIFTENCSIQIDKIRSNNEWRQQHCIDFYYLIHLKVFLISENFVPHQY